MDETRNAVYDVLKRIDGDISIRELAHQLGMSYQECMDVLVPVSKEFKEKNKREFSRIINSTDEFFLKEYFQDPLVNLALLIQTKIVDLNKNPSMQRISYQMYLNKWKEHRGF